MKKLLSLILVAVMLVTAMPIAMAEGNTYKVGDIIQFGSYPQSKVTDSATITALNSKAPAWDNWTSYGYYSGNGDYGTMKQGDWMRYTDIMYNGNKYRGVKFTQYRPFYTKYQSSSSDTHQDDNGYSTNTVYWFKFESIDWRVLDPSTGLVMCETIIDSQPYSNTSYHNISAGAFFNDSSCKNYASDYETSSIRQWLNNDFHNTAFTDSEKKEINTTILNNDGYNTSVGTTGYEKLDSNSTNDIIFLLSYNEVINNHFGFNSSASAYDKARFAQGSDYAKSQGLLVSTDGSYYGNSYWLLRSPGYDSICCCRVNPFGYLECNGVCDFSSNGVRPALCLEIIKHKHTYDEFITNPTCTSEGYTTYTCECGDTYVADYVDAKGHSYTSEVTIPTTHLTEGVETYTCHCGDTYTKPIEKLIDHTYTTVDTAPTCTIQGYTTYTCECGDSYVDDYVKENGHTFTNYISDSKATCTTDGSLIAKCDHCDANDTKPEKGTHKFSDGFTIDLDPTCTTVGQKSRHCLNCTEKTDITPIGKLAHTYKTIIIDPTCTDRGHKIYTCPCGDSYTETIPALGHNFSGSVCTECDYDKADTCSCNCHKSGLSALLWKILNFFYRLLRLNPTCNCGIAHY